MPVGVAVSTDGFDGAVGGLTAIRRAIRRPHDDARRLPVIFNDYMNTLMADPTTERLLPLIDAAAEVGAEYFCIDAGWYAEVDEGWWDTVGAWRPSSTRFPGGIAEVLDHIRQAGMVPGLWVEPEVVGVRSEIATQLPLDAFFQRGGRPVVEHGRYHLDLRHPAAVKHLDQVVDFLVGELGVGYLKFDYNISVGPGPDGGGLAAGAGLLAANRAQLDWLDAVLDRYPGLVIENCSSGGMRTDYALLARMQLQSTSDQREYVRYPPIAAAAPAAIAPEQAASWAYPQPEFSAGEIAFTMVNAMLGRIHLSGHLNRMSDEQRESVAEAVRAYKESLRPAIARSVPFWPLGLPRWDDTWIALGLRSPGSSHLAVWRRQGRDADSAAVTLSLPHLRGTRLTPRVLYPRQTGAEARWDAERGALTVGLDEAPAACVLRLEASTTVLPSLSAPRVAAAAFPDDELGRQLFHPARPGGVGDPVEQQGAGALAKQPHRLVNRGQRRGEQGTEVDVVEPGDGDVLGHPQAGRVQFPHGADRHLVVGADDGVGELVGAIPELPGAELPGGKKLAHGQLAAGRHEPALEGSRQPRPWMTGKFLFESRAPRPGVRRLRRSADVEQSRPAVPFDQVAHQRLGPRPVVGVHHVGLWLIGGAGDQRDRDPRSQPGHVLGGDALGDQQPVDLGRHLLQPLEGVRVVDGAAHGNEHRPAEGAERRLDAAQHLLDEQQAFLFDVGVRAAAFDGDEPDHFLAPAPHALGRAVGHVPKGLDHLKDAPPGRRANAVLAVHHPGDGGGGHFRFAGHVVQRAGRRAASPRRPVAHRGVPLKP